MQLMDMAGNSCGNFEGDTAPDGYWLRGDDAPDELYPLDFLDRIGATRFANIWSASLSHPEIAFQMVRGFAAQRILIGESFPALMMMETLGLLPTGTAEEIWQ